MERIPNDAAPERLEGLRVCDIPEIEGPSRDIQHRDELKHLVELPLLLACEALYDRNIRTVESSLFHGATFDEAWIQVHWETLSFENRHIGKNLGRVWHDRAGFVLDLLPPISRDMLVPEAQRAALEIASRFKQQDWLRPFYTREELLEKISLRPHYIECCGFSIPCLDYMDPEEIPEARLGDEELAAAGNCVFDTRAKIFVAKERRVASARD